MLLKNAYGNAILVVNNENDIALYKSKGYTEVKEKSKAEKKEPKEKSKA